MGSQDRSPTSSCNVLKVNLKGDRHMEKHRITAQTAGQVAEWFRTRGGVAIWRSVNLSNPGASWTCPINGPDGQPAGKPTWQADSKPARIITDPAEVEVTTYKEVRRFHVGLRRGSQGFSVKLTDGASRRLRRELEKAGPDSTYEFDYSVQDAVILVPDTVVPLTNLVSDIAGNPETQQQVGG
jgi:hypothetical protein